MRLPTLKPRQVIQALQRGGFAIHHQRGSHVYLRHPNKPGIQLCIPMHSADLKRVLLHGLLKDAGLTRDDFLRWL
jgi:predicted RNA binding protein YcfA (HicA-like mRNA interferase family)